MARQLRQQAAGLTYHVSALGNRKQSIFTDESDRTRFLGLLAHTLRTFEWTCHAYCLMTTHYHLMVTTSEANIGRGMHLLNGWYAQSFNRRHAARGHLFGDRYHSEVVEDDAYLLELTRYIALNPVRAGLCRTPEAWPWSSYRYLVGQRPAPEFLATDFLLECFSLDASLAPRRLREFVEAKLTKARRRAA